jgi:hypothetical protein
MTNSPTVVRSLLIYVICLPLAILVGYMMASPLEWGSFITLGMVLAILSVPLLLKFHHPLLMFGWNSSMIVFFLPGAPTVWLPLVALSLTISIVRRTIDPGYRFISVREITLPLIALAVVILVTAELTGGIKLRSMGGDTYGGKRYILMLGAVVGYFALTAQAIPAKRANLCIGLFLLGAATTLVGDVFYFNYSWLRWLYWFFPPNIGLQSNGIIGRFSGIANASSVFFSFMLAKYGIRKILTIYHPWRCLLLIVFAFISLFGGFRSVFITLVGVFTFQFFLEGLHRTRLMLVLATALILGGTLAFPFVRHLPYSVQRALAVLPLVEVDPIVRMDAEHSSEWRLNLWKALLPQVPKYLLLGKGFALTPGDYDYSLSNFTGAMQATSEDQSWAALAGDYHNGPLSVIILFGLWGAIAFIWFLATGFHVLYRNYRYGDPALKTINCFLFASFIVRTLTFFIIVGGIQFDLPMFAGYLGLSIALNGGVARRPASSESPTELALPVREGYGRSWAGSAR